MGQKKTRRAPRKYSYSPPDVAALVDLTPGAVRRLTKPRERRLPSGETVTYPPKLDLGDLGSVLAFVREHSPAEQTRIAKLLFAAGCDPTKAAAALGITRSTLYRWAKG